MLVRRHEVVFGQFEKLLILINGILYKLICGFLDQKLFLEDFLNHSFNKSKIIIDGVGGLDLNLFDFGF